MQIWDVLFGSLTELDLLRIGEALKIGGGSSMRTLQELLRDPRRRDPGALLNLVSDDTARLVVSRVGLPLREGQAARALLLEHVDGGTDWVTAEAPRRKPRLAWQGMHTQPAVEAVPVQVVEVVTPGLDARGPDRQLGLGGLGARGVRGQRQAVNRLLWTNDNLVALKTLAEERDPSTRAYRYRGQVDLIYIDPPFMVSNDFVADNSVTIDVDDAEGVSATKEPSVVELLAYKDTWREGLDSFLSMLRARLLILRELLAETGSIYVHLDWHAAHYVKVLMDEVFGYENFRNEIVWKRASARAGGESFNHVHDVILSYGKAESTYHVTHYSPFSAQYIRSHYGNSDERGRFRLVPLNAPGTSGGETGQPWRGYEPPKNRHWSHVHSKLDELAEAGLIQFPTKGKNPELKQYLNETEGIEINSMWDDIPPVNSQAAERLGYPTQKPVALLERIISASCPPGGLVLDAFMGSGTTVEAAERLGRRFIGIDNGKYAVHLARKRLITLHGQPRPPAQEQHDYVECETCKNIERKAKGQKSPGRFEVRPFSVESVGVYLGGQPWIDALGEGSAWRAEMVKVFGGEPSEVHPQLHGRKEDAWVFVGPLDQPVSERTAWAVARAAADTELHAVELLSADLDPLPQGARDELLRVTGVRVTVRVIPQAAIDQVRQRLSRGKSLDGALESMAIPAFYTPLAISLRAVVDGPVVKLSLERCEVDAQSFIRSQRPALKATTEGMTDSARKKAEAERVRWTAREATLNDWLSRATTWQHFVDFWAVDWDYADDVTEAGRSVFNTEWQGFAARAGKKKGRVPPTFVAEARYDRPGRYQIAARVVDVFGNDGVAVVDVVVGP